jgi:hypothetical protein
MTRQRRRVGVLTFHRCINHGSYWQARCLVDGLRARGHDAVILDHDSPRVNRAEWRCALRPTLPTPVPRADRPLYREKIAKFFTAISQLPLSPMFDLADPGAIEGFDSVLVGSDEVWNLAHPWYGGCPLFFGEGIGTEHLASYAASFGSYDRSAGLGEKWTDRLARFSAISVRDDNSRAIVSAAIGREPELVLDPCLQFLPRPEGEWSGPDEPFVAVYGHNFSHTFACQVRRWAELRRVRLVSISYRNDWADAQWIDAGPHDFAHAIARADAVVTNFFHGCVFALCNERPFVCETSGYREHKLRSLLTSVGAEAHLVSAETHCEEYDARLREPIAPPILVRVDELRTRSDGFLERALA